MPDDPSPDPRIIPVVVTAPLDGPFDYRCDASPPEPGTFVMVSFGNREIVGVVWDYAGAKRASANKIKNVGAILDAPLMPKAVRQMIDHASRETLSPRGSVLKLAIAVPKALQPPSRKPGFRRKSDPAWPKAKPQQRVLEMLADGTVHPQPAITKAAKVPSSTLQAMVDTGLIEQHWIEERLFWPNLDLDLPGPSLSEGQGKAATRLIEAVRTGHETILLEGVPGAGKTEVYLEAVIEALRRNKRVLVLLPEIALSAPWIKRFKDRFGIAPVVWHSGLTSKQRVLAWQAIARGDIPLVVGARSALFLPISDLGLIIVDEEHDPSFKQEDGVVYHARELAEYRASIEDCPIVLASATPAIETSARAQGLSGRGSIKHLYLAGRYGGAAMPTIRLVDLRKDRPEPKSFLSNAVIEALKQAKAAGQQSLIFLNRRGYAPLTLCRACGHRLQCPSCSAWLVSHRFRKRLMCHHCGYGIDQPEHCPSCGSVDMLVASGPGVERLSDEITNLLPDATIALLTSDTPSSHEIPALLDRMVSGDIDVLIGTQIIAKGHHFPNLTNVVVADADLGLAGGDLRAAERSFQLLYQVAGRAGREKLKGHVLIQTHLPDHPVIEALASGDKDHFYEVELAERQAMAMPPFGRLAALIISGPDVAQVQDQARRIARAAPEEPGLTVLGPAPAPLSLLRGRYRERILIKCGPGDQLADRLRRWLTPIRLPAKTHLTIDVDPQSFL